MVAKKIPRKTPIAPDDVFTAHVEMTYLPFEAITVSTVSLYDGRLDRVIHKESFSHVGVVGAESAVHDAAGSLALAFDILLRERGWGDLRPNPETPAAQDPQLPFGDPHVMPGLNP